MEPITCAINTLLCYLVAANFQSSRAATLISAVNKYFLFAELQLMMVPADYFLD